MVVIRKEIYINTEKIIDTGKERIEKIQKELQVVIRKEQINA